MDFLKASWGFVVMIGGLFVTLTLLMVLDGPQSGGTRCDAKTRPAGPTKGGPMDDNRLGSRRSE